MRLFVERRLRGICITPFICTDLNHELFYMIETSVDINLLASLYSSQLITKDKKSLVDKKRFYFEWITEILSDGLSSGEFKKSNKLDRELRSASLPLK